MERDINTVVGETLLRDRVNGDWSVFEAHLFNLITSHGPKTDGMYFSGRLRLVERALAAIKEEWALMLAERELLPNSKRMGIIPENKNG